MRSKLHKVRETVAQLRQALLAHSPEAIDAQAPALEEAALALQELQQESPEPDARAEAEALAREIQGASKLIANGAAVARGMARLLASAAACYGPDGEPAAVAPQSTIAVRG